MTEFWMAISEYRFFTIFLGGCLYIFLVWKFLSIRNFMLSKKGAAFTLGLWFFYLLSVEIERIKSKTDPNHFQWSVDNADVYFASVFFHDLTQGFIGASLAACAFMLIFKVGPLPREFDKKEEDKEAPIQEFAEENPNHPFSVAIKETPVVDFVKKNPDHPIAGTVKKRRPEAFTGVPLKDENEAEPPTIPFLEKLRFEHTLVLGGTGHGKTQFLSELISLDLYKPYSLVVFDSQGDLASHVLNVDIPRDRIVYIDPTDLAFPIAFGLFDFKSEADTPFEREKHLNSVIELLTFVLGSLDAEMTSKMDVLFQYAIRLCLVIPDSNILTLRDIFSEGGITKHIEYVDKLPDTAQQFLRYDWDNNRQYGDTKSHISRRIHSILSNSALERIFSNTKTKLNMQKELDEGKIILVNTAKSFLKEEGSAFFTRFIVALIFQAIQERDLQKDNIPVFMYIDEAAPIIDKQVTNMLETARKYKMGVTLAFQSLGQIPSGLEHSIITNTSIKVAGGVSAKDAKALERDMDIEPEFLMGKSILNFYMNVRGKTFYNSRFDEKHKLYHDHIPYKVNLASLEKLPKRTDKRELIENNRQKYCVYEYPTEQKPYLKVAEPGDDIEDLNKA